MGLLTHNTGNCSLLPTFIPHLGSRVIAPNTARPNEAARIRLRLPFIDNFLKDVHQNLPATFSSLNWVDRLSSAVSLVSSLATHAISA